MLHSASSPTVSSTEPCTSKTLIYTNLYETLLNDINQLINSHKCFSLATVVLNDALKYQYQTDRLQFSFCKCICG